SARALVILRRVDAWDASLPELLFDARVRGRLSGWTRRTCPNGSLVCSDADAVPAADAVLLAPFEVVGGESDAERLLGEWFMPFAFAPRFVRRVQAAAGCPGGLVELASVGDELADEVFRIAVIASG